MLNLQLLCVALFTAANLVAAAQSENDIDSDEYIYSKKGPICVTPGCVKAAATILDNLDQTIEPCDDFYQFACGGFIQKHVIPEDKTSVNYFNIIGDQIIEQLRLLLEKPIAENEPKPFVLVKKFYNTCLNTTHIEEDGLETIKNLLQKLGGWPVLAGLPRVALQFDWKQLMYDSRLMGLPTNRLLSVYVASDVLNSSRRIINMDQAILGLEREYLVNGFDDPIVKAYYNFLVDIAVMFGADKQLALHEMDKVIEFEIKLARITFPKEERRNISLMTNIMTVGELQEKFPFIPWQEYISNVIAGSGYKAQQNDMLDIAVPRYLKHLDILLQRTPNRTVANYLFNQIVLTTITSLTKQLRNRELDFDAIHYGTRAMQARWKECTVAATSKLRLAADALYVRDYISDDVKRNAEELINNLKAAFTDMLKNIDWMDENTKKEALEKAALMRARIAYAPELRDIKKLEEYYLKLEPAETLLEFNLNINKFVTDTKSETLHKPVSKTDWTENSFVCSVDAYYNMMENSLQLPAGILQGIFFDHDRPNYLNYGSMGFAIGHEITHGFDDEGRQYDKDGNLRDWWAQETGEAFLNKAQCIIDQYSNHTASEVNLKLNGVNTQGENVADNGGVKEAYLAYNAWINRNGEEPRLPGLNYSPKQLFWISTANLWCQKMRTEFLRQSILTNAHCPAKYRVIIPLSNSEEFAKDYNCPVGSKMNPEKKCHVW